MEVFQSIAQTGFMGFVILGMGVFSIGLAFERFVALFQKYSFNAAAFSKKVHEYIRTDRVEEAIALCQQLSTKPLANAYKTILEHTGKTDDHVMQAQDIALSENVPKLTERLGYLSMIANVATLVGLLGTIQGLIMAFSAVSNADPAAKQTLLAQGISIAMYTTALGLTVAIPTMIIYSILHSKQTALINEMNTHTSRLVELLTDNLPSQLDKESSGSGQNESAKTQFVQPPAPDLKVA
jgi:biopolymer transport protein ExbB